MFYAPERASKWFARASRVATESRVVAAAACATALAALVLTAPRMGQWFVLWLLPVFSGVGFALGLRVRAAKARAAISELKSRLAHELNNPLSILLDQLDHTVSALDRANLTHAVPRTSEIKHRASEALAAASSIARVVRDLDAASPIWRERPVPTKSGPIPKPIRARILVIDDEPQVAASLRRLLYRHEVTVATSGFEAQGLLQSQPFDVVVSDVMMPEPSGLDVFERLTRTQPDLARRFVFVTGGTYTQRARELLASIPNTRLGKPVDAIALERAIAEVHQGLEPSVRTRA